MCAGAEWEFRVMGWLASLLLTIALGTVLYWMGSPLALPRAAPAAVFRVRIANRAAAAAAVNAGYTGPAPLNLESGICLKSNGFTATDGSCWVPGGN